MKQDPSKGVVDLVLRDTTTKEHTHEKLRSELKSILEQVISLVSYPRTIFNFQVFLTHWTDAAHLFAACANGLFTALHQGGIKMKAAPAAAMTLGVTQREGDELEFEVAEGAGQSLLHLVMQGHRDVLFMRVEGAPLDVLGFLGNEKSLAFFESVVEERSLAVYNAISLPQ